MTDAEAEPERLKVWWKKYAGRFKAWWKRTTPSGPILLTAGLGLLLVGLVLLGNWCICDDPTALWQKNWCTTVGASPPWTLLSGLAAGPSLLLLWIWRTKHRVEDINIAQQSQITGRFVSAIQLLSDEKMAARLGGIYSLERIAKDEPESYGVVAETLAAFVRDQSPRNVSETPEEEPAQDESQSIGKKTDVQAALTVLGRLIRPQGSVLRHDLSHTDLRGANLTKADLMEADLMKANLSHADLQKANLRGAFLYMANLGGANLIRADLRGANLIRADLEGAKLSGAMLYKADLRGAKLRGAKNLTQEQVDLAYGDSETQLPKGIERPEHWK